MYNQPIKSDSEHTLIEALVASIDINYFNLWAMLQMTNWIPIGNHLDSLSNQSFPNADFAADATGVAVEHRTISLPKMEGFDSRPQQTDRLSYNVNILKFMFTTFIHSPKKPTVNLLTVNSPIPTLFHYPISMDHGQKVALGPLSQETWPVVIEGFSYLANTRLDIFLEGFLWHCDNKGGRVSIH